MQKQKSKSGDLHKPDNKAGFNNPKMEIGQKYHLKVVKEAKHQKREQNANIKNKRKAFLKMQRPIQAKELVRKSD